MRTDPPTPADLARSVIAVPPLCLTADLGVAVEENRRLVRHVEAGGVSSLLWGGNAQVQHWPVSRYGELLDMAEATAAPSTWVIPAAGPDYGKLLDQGRLLARLAFPCALALPMATHWTPDGVARALRDFAQAAGRPAFAYVRSEGYLAPDSLAGLVARGEVCAVKYGVPHPDPSRDPYLADLVAAIGRERIVSGSGEVVALPHLRSFALAGFTAGCVCLAPRLSMRVRDALLARDFAFGEALLGPVRALEALRERHSPIAVLHEAVRLAGLAETGPVYPMLANAPPELHEAIEAAARLLLEAEARLRAEAKTGPEASRPVAAE